jgi:hypothetical protein
MFSQEISLENFFIKNYDPKKEYRLTLDTRNNSCVYASMDIIRLPDFKKCSYLEIEDFKRCLLNRKWTWLQDPRFKYLYVYILKDKVYICDRDNIPLKEPSVDFSRIEKNFKNETNIKHDWLSKKIN